MKGWGGLGKDDISGLVWLLGGSFVETDNEVTEEMIEGMRKKAERVQEYMVEQKNEKGKVVVG